MREAKVLFRNEEAGSLIQQDDGTFLFRYNHAWVVDGSKPSISLTLPKEKKEFHSKYLFPFFYHMLPEGSNKQIACKLNRIEKDDYFGILMTNARYDTIGAVQIRGTRK
jgi:HipA-like protein